MKLSRVKEVTGALEIEPNAAKTEKSQKRCLTFILRDSDECIVLPSLSVSSLIGIFVESQRSMRQDNSTVPFPRLFSALKARVKSATRLALQT